MTPFQPPTHLERFRDILSRCTYKNWRFIAQFVEPHYYYFQIEFDGLDTDTGRASLQRGRKWLLSTWMTESEIAQTALKAVLTAEEHEAREQFLVEGVPVFGPHFDVFALAIMSQAGMLPLAHRTPPVSAQRSAENQPEPLSNSRGGT